jgi:transcription elongation factor GreA
MAPNKEPVYLTAQGLQELKSELDELVTVRRPEIAATILAAREDGDLKENGAYHDAKDRQGVIEGRIRLLKAKLQDVRVIETPVAADVVDLGSAVTLISTAGKEQYNIVGSMEANVRAGRISNESPLGRALMGRKVGEIAIVQAPGGEISYTITGVDRAS